MLAFVLAEHFGDVVCFIVKAVYLRSAKHQGGLYLIEVYIRRDTFPLNPDNLTPYPNSFQRQPTFIQIILPLIPRIEQLLLISINNTPIIVTMKFFAVTLAAFLAVAGTAVTAPTEAPVDVMEIFPRTGDKDIEKRGYGCRAIGSDDVGVCNFHVRHRLLPSLSQVPRVMNKA